MRLSPLVTVPDVNEAVRLMRVSTAQHSVAADWLLSSAGWLGVWCGTVAWGRECDTWAAEQITSLRPGALMLVFGMQTFVTWVT